MDQRSALLFPLIGVVILGAVAFIIWRLQRLKTQQLEAEKRSAVAFEEMNKFTKELRERGKEGNTDPTRRAGEKLIEMYPGPKRPAQ